jgi:trimeric autotransporter adhesin
MKGNKHMKTITNIIHPLFALFAFACFALAPQARAVCQDACLTNQNTVQGDDALLSLTTGFGDTAIGFQALYSNTIGHGNNAIGVQALYSNIDGIDNTAIGYFTLLSNLSGTGNTAIGDYALYSNTNGGANTATGDSALASNTTGNNNTANGVLALFSNNADSNTATGYAALYSNTIGSGNTASGVEALYSNTTGRGNTANGRAALYSNTTGRGNTANGRFALQINTSGDFNTATGNFALSSNATGSENLAYGSGALFSNTTGNANAGYGGDALFGNTTGSFNVAVGFEAGSGLTTGDNNINIGPYVSGVAAESNTIRIGTQGTQTNAYIAGIYSTPVAKGLVVKVDSSGHLGTVGSSGRFKEQIKPMGNASEAILGLKPVTFRYKKEIDPERNPEFGLVAEEVEKVDPDLVACDEQGKPYTVRYDAVNVMLLNEFLKEHTSVQEQARQIQQQKATISELKHGMETVVARLKEQDSRIEKVSAQIEMDRPTPKVVVKRP